MIDVHVHTNVYSGCARSTPHEMVAQAARLGLNGLVFTEHEVVWPQGDLDALQEAFPSVRLFRGVELTASDGNDLLVYGVDNASWYDPTMSLVELIQAAHHLGGAVVWAHPLRWGPDTVPLGIEACGPEAMEVASGNMLSYLDGQVEALRRRLGVRGIVASDAHHWSQLGGFAARFRDPIADVADLVQALRGGRFDIYMHEQRVSELGISGWVQAMPHLHRLRQEHLC